MKSKLNMYHIINVHTVRNAELSNAFDIKFGVNIILLQHIQFHIVHLYRQFTLDWK